MWKIIACVISLFLLLDGRNLLQTECTCNLNIYAGGSCKLAPLKSFSGSAQEKCEDLDVLSFKIVDCQTSSLDVDFYIGGSCTNLVDSVHFNLTTCYVVPDVSDLSFNIKC